MLSCRSALFDVEGLIIPHARNTNVHVCRTYVFHMKIRDMIDWL